MGNMLNVKPNIQNQTVADNKSKQQNNLLAKEPVVTNSRVGEFEPIGHFVDTPLYKAPIVWAKDLKQDTINLKKAVIDGKSTDNNLGRLNDLALKIGSFCIASYLFTQKGTKAQKGMEFIGGATFLASMALWPKIFIQLPVKLFHGINPFREYVNSQGEKRKFSQDPQYKPWNLYSPEEMDKLGDRLNIPKNIKNRSDYTQEKADKIMTQANTLWMLSAGLGTPLMAAMTASAIDKYFTPAVTKYIVAANPEKELQNLVTSPDTIAKDFKAAFVDDNGEIKLLAEPLSKIGNIAIDVNPKLQSLLKDNIGTKTNNDLIQELAGAIVADGDKNAIDVMKNVLTQLIEKSEYGNYSKLKGKDFSKYLKNDTDIEDVKNIVKLLIDFKAGKMCTGTVNISEIANEIAKTSPDIGIEQALRETRGLCEYDVNNVYKLSSAYSYLLKAKQAFSKYADRMCGENAESLATVRWNQITNKFFDVLKFKKTDVNTLVNNGTKGFELLDNKLASIAKNPEAYKKALSNLSASIINFDKEFGNSFIISTENAKDSFIFRLHNNLKSFENYSDIIKNIPGMESLNINTTIADAVESKSIKLIQGKQSSFYKMILGFDFMKKLENGELEKQYKELLSGAGKKDYYHIPDGMDEKSYFEKLVKLGKSILFEGDISDVLNRNNLTAEDGKMTYPLINDLIFQTDLTKETKDAIGENLAKNINFYQDSVWHNFIQSYVNRFKDVVTWTGSDNNALINAQQARLTGIDKLAKFLGPEQLHASWGDNLLSMVSKSAEQVSNTGKWFKIFGTAAAITAAVTVASTFFFGNIHIPKNQNSSKDDNLNSNKTPVMNQDRRLG